MKNCLFNSGAENANILTPQDQMLKKIGRLEHEIAVIGQKLARLQPIPDGTLVFIPVMLSVQQESGKIIKNFSIRAAEYSLDIKGTIGENFFEKYSDAKNKLDNMEKEYLSSTSNRY